METVDINATEESVDTTEALPDTPEAPASDQATTQSQTETDQKPYVPFSGGKEKFKINGKDYEWTWDETKRYAQIGRSGQIALERAAQVEKKAKDAYQKLLDAAQKDPEGLIRVLNPTWQGFQSTAKPAQAGDNQADEVDPRDSKIDALERKIRQLEERDEVAEIEKERQAIEAELDAAVKQYPELDNKIYRDHVKSQYRRHLQNGIEDITIDDVAFHVAQELKEMRAEQEKRKVEKVRENRKAAPVSAVPGGSSGTPRMTREEIMRLAGRTA